MSAKIRKLAVTEGQWVEKGTFLVGLDRERYVAAVESAEANVRSAEANASLVQREHGAGREGTGAVDGARRRADLESQSGLDDKQTAYQVEVARQKSALEQVEQARAALKQARDDLAKTTIYSPMAGTVSELNKEEGEIALGSQFQADVILVVADLSEMEAQVNVDENDIVSIHVGQAAEIQVDALPDQILTGIVHEIAAARTLRRRGPASRRPSSRSRSASPSPPKTLRPGMTASAEIMTKTNASALSVPLQ